MSAEIFRAGVHRDVHAMVEGARDHELWKRDFTGACGLFGVMLRPVEKACVDGMLNGMRLFRMGWSWGGFESLSIRANVERARRTLPWHASGPYLRLHVGLEHPADLIADLADGFERLRG